MEIEQLIKMILGILVFVAVVGGTYLIFKNDILDFFKNLGGNESNQAGKLVLYLIK